MEVETPFIGLEEGWSYMETGISKLKRILEGEPEPQFESKEYTSLYTVIYNMCTQKPPHDYSQQLYDRYRETIEDYCKQTVLPSLRMKHDEHMLKELALRWSNHKVMVRWLSSFFYYIDRYFVDRTSLPTLKEVGLKCFHDLVYNEMKAKATEAAIALIHKERDGEEIDRALLKNVLEIYIEIAMGHMNKYVDDFETFMLQDTSAYYSRKASSWIQEYSYTQYMLKAEMCLREERERVTHYLHISTEPKLVKALTEVIEFFKTVAGSPREVEKPSPEELIRRMKI